MKTTFLYRSILILILLFGTIRSFSQVVIPDANFRQYLITKFPTAMNPDQTLKPSGAAAVTGQFKCYNQNITNLSGIEYFTGITTLEVKYNPGLTSIPNINSLVNVTTIGLDSNALTSLPNLSTLSNLQILSCHHNNLTALPSLAGLTKITLIFVHNNKITNLPDLSSQTKLDWLFCSNNPLVSLPSFSTNIKLRVLMCDHTLITSVPSLNNCPLMEYFICNDTKLTSLPVMNNCVNLIGMDVYNCQLTDLTDISTFPALNSINAKNNFLSFEDIKPLMANANFSTFVVSPQTIQNPSSLVAYEKSQVNVTLGVDPSLPDNVYTWYKNGIFFQTTSVNKLSFNSISPSDAGLYTCRVTNSTAGLSLDTLVATPITLTITPCVLSYDVRYEILSTDCAASIKIQLDESSFTGGTRPYLYKLKSAKDSVQSTSNLLALNNEGNYNLTILDAAGCSVSFPKKITIQRGEKCDPVFYPNGDGIADTYFIEETGFAKIYNRSGELIKEIATPANWDGTNKKGQDAPTGLYVIVVNDNINIKVTILR